MVIRTDDAVATLPVVLSLSRDEANNQGMDIIRNKSKFHEGCASHGVGVANHNVG
jgi:hypothetical protein